MIRKSWRQLAFTTALLSLGCVASAATVYNESTSGDLSNSGLTPTLLPVSLGSNVISGTTGRGTAIDRDYFTIVIPTGQQLSSIIEQPGTAVAGAVSFFGVQSGNQVTVATNATTADGLLGWWHYSTDDIGNDILPLMAVASNGSSGFSGALPAGTYSFWIQDFGAGTFNYGFDLRLTAATNTATPEPGTFASGAIAVLVLTGIIARRRRQQARVPLCN